MKALVLFLVMLAGDAWSACAANTLAYWDFPTYTDPCNGYNLTMGGTVPTVAVACDGSQMSGPYNTTNKFTTPAGFNTALAAVSGVTYEMYVYITTTVSVGGPGAVGVLFRGAGTPAAWEINIGATAGFPQTANWRRFSGAWDGVNTGAVLNQNTCHHIAVTTDGTTMKIYVDNVEKGSKNVASSLASSVTSFTIGTDGSSIFSSGYLSGFRVSDIVRTTFPTVDTVPAAAPTLMSPFLRQILSPRLPPPSLR